jgi:hypothetical protein
MDTLLRPEPGPTTLKETRWGGARLAGLRGAPAGARIGESWEFSTLPGHESRAGGRPLGERLGGPLPWLAKLIDTALPLSVQVHPGDGPDAPGKEEAWVVLAADPGAVVWAGLAPDADPDAFARAVLAGDPGLLGMLRAIPVAAGSVVLVPARTVHAIGPGILLAEIQQPRDCTYRFYDHGSARAIQPRDALAVVDLAAQARVWRPGEPGTTLTGAHVELELLGPGAHRRDVPAAPTLVVPALGRAAVRTADGALDLGPGDLALARRGPWWIEVSPGGACVLGCVDRRPGNPL